ARGLVGGPLSAIENISPPVAIARVGAGLLGHPDLIPSMAQKAEHALGIEADRTASRPARYAGTFAEFFRNPLTSANPPPFSTKLGAATLGALGSETAGQLTEGTAWEPWARLAGGLGGGLAGSRAGPRVGQGLGRLHEATEEFLIPSGPEGVPETTLGMALSK